MVGVLKVENMDYKINRQIVRQIFKEHGARPSDIHIIKDANNQPTGSCFVTYKDNSITKHGLNVDGLVYENNRVKVRESSKKEFQEYFPRRDIISKPGGLLRKQSKKAYWQARDAKKKARLQKQKFQNDVKPFSFQQRSSADEGRDSFGNKGRPPIEDARENAGSSFEKERYGNNPRDRRGRSRSPLKRREKPSTREEFLKNFGQLEPDNRRYRQNDRAENKEFVRPRQNDTAEDLHFARSRQNDREENKEFVPYDQLDNFNINRYVKVWDLPYDVTEVEIQDFLRPILTRHICYLKYPVGKYAAMPNGFAIVELYTEEDAIECLKLDGSRFRNKITEVSRPEENDIIEVIQDKSRNKAPPAQPSSSSVPPSLSNLANVAGSNPQVAHLLNLLSDTVNAMSTGGSSNSQINNFATASGATSQPNNFATGKASNKQPKREPRRIRNSRKSQRFQKYVEKKMSDPVVSRVADNANIDTRDITMGRVVGMRNLPDSVTNADILQFFQGYHAIYDSVRIHYFDDGRCSGDAIISFRERKDARKAIYDLKERTIGGQKVNLFNL